MIYFTPKHFPPGESSHMAILIKVMEISQGDVLELGTGFFSTPLLHWLCNEQKRKLFSCESDPRFIEVAKNFITGSHSVQQVDNWDELDLESKHWGVVFIDHAPGKRRHVELERMAQHADYVVVHDAEAKSDWHYNFTKGFPLYKYRYDYKNAYPETSVLSNFKDLKELCD